jgi:hypothetical protein
MIDVPGGILVEHAEAIFFHGGKFLVDSTGEAERV